MISTNRIYHTIGMIGLAFLTWVAWTEPLLVVLRGGEVFPAPMKIAQWVLPVVTFLVGWVALGNPPTWLRWITTPAAAGIWLQGFRYVLGMDSPVLVGLRWCWIVRDSTLVEQKTLLEKAYSTELTRLFEGKIPVGVSVTPPEANPEVLLWGDLTTLGTSRALHEHSTWLVKSLPPVPTPALPNWGDWVHQWGPALVAGAVLVAGIALVWYYNGAINDVDQSTRQLGGTVSEVALGLATAMKQSARIESNSATRFHHLLKSANESTLKGNRIEVTISYLFRVITSLAEVGGDPSISPASMAEKIAYNLVRQSVEIIQELYFTHRGDDDGGPKE